MWFVQHIASEVRVIDFHQDAQRPFSHYLHVLQSRGYVPGTVWLPHDAQAKSLGTGRSVEEIARSAGCRVRIVPKLSIADGINAVRTLFPVMWFDRERCADGVQALRHYRYADRPGGELGAHKARRPV
jgi:phage terminase large subunit